MPPTTKPDLTDPLTALRFMRMAEDPDIEEEFSSLSIAELEAYADLIVARLDPNNPASSFWKQNATNPEFRAAELQNFADRDGKVIVDTVPPAYWGEYDGQHFMQDTPGGKSKIVRRKRYVETKRDDAVVPEGWKPTVYHLKGSGVPDQCEKCGTTGELWVCTGCNVYKYCSRMCQRQDWPDHREPCHTVRKAVEGWNAKEQEEDAKLKVKEGEVKKGEEPEVAKTRAERRAERKAGKKAEKKAAKMDRSIQKSNGLEDTTQRLKVSKGERP
ncbi:uncharacterized protein BDZ99DRAFT_517831 [Mytilinidion resinicola]|uniref:MYND-type domain-containing protein n=1 Tax=Mytilinidion resinicola TaxID=574789 RepID=A0A6A6Z073_9PEZI|nr:uncharacterized protein BDZ99DRAFT_517831 [Mytilinidion resinicola]KAF2813585.1 hypothetical protein BDZ99DRAFT_517831 [Mytilinidion resinicola]